MHNFKYSEISALVLSTAIFSNSHVTFAATNQLEPVVVTASRTRQLLDDTLASVTVISRQELDRSQARSLDEVLRNYAGIHTVQTGGYGKSTNVYIRGTNSSHVLVLVDGVRAASSTLGIFSWENFPLDNIERIEIVRGPRASLYGSDAIGGVVQIFTRHGGGTHFRIAAGSHRTGELEVGTGGGDTWKYSLDAGILKTEGYPTNTIFTEAHGYKNRHGGISLEGPLSDSTQVKLHLNQAQGKNEQDPDTGDSDFIHRVASATILQQTSPNWLQTIILGNTLDLYESYSPYSPATITTRRNSISWQNDIDTSLGTTSAGIDFWEDHARKDNSGEIDKTVHTTGLFLQQQLQQEQNQWILGIRNDRHDEFGNYSTWNLGWGRKFGKTHLTASYGTAFKAPGINDLFWPYNVSSFGGITYIEQGNPNLDPETSHSAELGISYNPDPKNRIEAHIFVTRADDLITWSSTQTGPTEYTYTPENINKAEIEGLELSSTHSIGAWDLQTAFTYLHAIDAATGLQLDRRPRRTLTLQATQRLHKGNIRYEALAVSRRNDANGSIQLGGYTLLNMGYEYPINREYTVRLRVENLLDKAYTTATSFSGAYNSPGRTIYLTFAYQQVK